MAAPALVVLLAIAVMLPGCSEGEYIPLLAPGGNRDWPADPRWHSLSVSLGDPYFMDGVWNTEALSEGPTIVLVTLGTEALEYADGQWTVRTNGLAAGMLSVVQVGADEFVAVGAAGAASRRKGNTWRTEETGTDNSLGVVVAADGVVWAAGWQGTVRRWENGVWSGLPTAGDDDLVGIAVLHDSLFVAARGGGIRVWDGLTWGVLPDGPWGTSAVQGVAAAGRLYAAAGSLYVREPAGWRTITDTDLHGPYAVDMKVTGGLLWYEFYGNWRNIDTVGAPWQPQLGEFLGSGVLAPRADGDYLVASWGPTFTWVEEGVARRDPAGLLDGIGIVPLSTGGLLNLTDIGVILREATSQTLVLAMAQIPLIDEFGFRAGYGHNPDDYYLAGYRCLYHCVGGQATLLGTWDEERRFNSLAIGADNVLYGGDDDGVWRWQGTSWQRVLPLLAAEAGRHDVWSLGNGNLGALDQDGQYYRTLEGQWSSLGYTKRNTLLLAGSDGTLFTVGPMNSTDDFPGGNALRVFDDRAGVFQDLWQQGMGPLVDLDIEGGTSRDGEVLIWTRDPVMVFTLSGPPTLADWQVVAGPLDANIVRVERLPDGNLLAQERRSGGFHLYRP